MATTTELYPSYLPLYRSGELARRAEQALELLRGRCRVCPVGCAVDRWRDEPGDCHVGRYALVHSHGPHFGEEPVLRGWQGSGTVFFGGCNLHCVYCQNYEISQLRVNCHPVAPEGLALIFLRIQAQGCHNLNLVTPSHVVPQMLEALAIAVGQGFSLPLVYNTSSYDSLHSLHLLDGVVDIYMPDIKYADPRTGFRYSGVKAYFQVAKRMVKEMQRQTGDLIIGSDGLARRGLLIRHLVLPHDIAGSRAILDFIADELSRDAYVNIMDQYRPAYRAFQHRELASPVGRGEWQEMVQYALARGIHRGIPFDDLLSVRRRRQ